MRLKVTSVNTRHGKASSLAEGGWLVENVETKIPSPSVPTRSLIRVCFNQELCLVRVFFEWF